MPPGQTAVIADEWPLVRLGIAQALRAKGIRVVGESAQGEDALLTARRLEAGLFLIGAVRDVPVGELARRAVELEPPLHVFVLLDSLRREDMVGVVGSGVHAVLLRSVRPDELADAIERVGRRERVVAPALMPLLVGALGPADDGEDEAAEGGLTRKELEVLARLAQGLSNRDIAEALFITPATVKTHLTHIYTKLGVAGRQEALSRAVALGLLG